MLKFCSTGSSSKFKFNFLAFLNTKNKWLLDNRRGKRKFSPTSLVTRLIHPPNLPSGNVDWRFSIGRLDHLEMNMKYKRCFFISITSVIDRVICKQVPIIF